MYKQTVLWSQISIASYKVPHLSDFAGDIIQFWWQWPTWIFLDLSLKFFMNLLSFSLVAIGFQESIRKCRECEEIMRNGGLYRLQNKRSSGCGYKDSDLISYASWEGNMSAWVYMQKCLVVWYLILYKNLAIYIYIKYSIMFLKTITY